jgi:beta-glucosidase
MPLVAEYSEMMEIGYRWYQANHVKPKYAFGHGLGYTTFAYSSLTVVENEITFTLSNTGTRPGTEVAQLYLTFPPSSGEPPKQLKGFQKVSLVPGASTSITFHVQPRDISIWDVAVGAFVPQTGRFGVTIGASSEDDRLYGSLIVNA